MRRVREWAWRAGVCAGVCVCCGGWAIAEESVRPTETTSAGTGLESSKTLEAPRREGAALMKAVRAALKDWERVPNDQAESVAKIFVVLYDELKADTKLKAHARARATEDIRKKLNTLSQKIARHAKNQERAGQAPKSVKLPEGRDAVVGQFAGGGQDMEHLNRSSELATAHGERLVELIQNTIQPDSWEANGGPGAIQYWTNQRSLIILQTDPIHDEIRGTLDQLRRAGN